MSTILDRFKDSVWKYQFVMNIEVYTLVKSGCGVSQNNENSDGLVQDCGISSALAMEILQSCTKS